MPRRDRTGPEGRGPLTGRGMGPCDSGIQRGFGRGFRRGRGMYFGRGLGRRFSDEYIPKMSKDEEKSYLEKEAELLEQDLKYIKEKMEKLE